MEIFLVGGAVRDFLLAKMHDKLKTSSEIQDYWANVEKDWVVVGSTPQEMLSLGYRQVGKSFPVFLHPATQEEYALARTERKVGKGYTGFECFAEPSVTLEEDLKRRDLTINAIAMYLPNPDDFANYEIIDPYCGCKDLKDKIFRHVSEAFAEDPVRILRVARLGSRFGDFQVASTTQTLMAKMVQEGEVDALVPERVWQEWARSLKEDYPWRFFEILRNCHALEKLFNHVDDLLFKQKVLELAVKENAPETIRLAIQLHDLQEEQLAHLIDKYRIAHDFRDLTMLVAKWYSSYVNLVCESSSILELLEKTDAFRRPERFHDFLWTCDLLTETNGKNDKHKSSFLKKILQQLMQIDNAKILQQGYRGAEFAEVLRKERLEKIERSTQSDM